tara:strand:+ start:11884 stop:12738 length:855 start_codon:yes stop_codon:yes gene_type:complete
VKKIRLSKKRLTVTAFLKARYAVFYIFFIAAAAIILAISLSKPSAFETLRANAIDTAAPVIEAINAPINAVTNAVHDITNVLKLRETNEKLSAENQKLMQWYLYAQTLESENSALRDLVKIKNLPPLGEHESISAAILNDTSNDFAKSILIKAGASDGVHKNAIAISSRGLVGQVIEAADNTARILLITDINARVPVVIEHNGQMIHAMMSGQNDNAPILSHVASQMAQKTLRAMEGAHIITSGAGDLFPYGLPVGTLKTTPKGTLFVEPYMKRGDFLFVHVLM